jgi:hypothetical protein
MKALGSRKLLLGALQQEIFTEGGSPIAASEPFPNFLTNTPSFTKPSKIEYLNRMELRKIKYIVGEKELCTRKL